MKRGDAGSTTTGYRIGERRKSEDVVREEGSHRGFRGSERSTGEAYRGFFGALLRQGTDVEA